MKSKLAIYREFSLWSTDMHVHSESSNCSTRKIDEIIDESYRKKLSLIGIVDHLHCDNLESLKNRREIGNKLLYNDSLNVLYGIEIDFFKNNQDYYQMDLLQNFDFIVGAIHWLNGYNVNFFPETKPENKEKGLKPIDLREEIINEIKRTEKETFFDLYLGTITSMLKSKSIDVWAHPFRSLGFLLIYNEDYIDYFTKEYLNDILYDLSKNEIYFEINEGLNNSLKFRGGEYYTEKMENKWTKFYSFVVRKLLEYNIPIIIGTDSHSQSVQIGYYPWIKKILD